MKSKTAVTYSDRDLGMFVESGLMTLSDAYVYAWRRDNAGRAAERAAINSGYVPPTE